MLDRSWSPRRARNGPHSARGKNMTVLMHVWVLVPEPLVQLRDDGLNLLYGRSGRDRLPVHWGMCLATYPFFRDVAETTGRLLALQGRARLSQIVRRTTESWGSRSTVVRASQRLVRTLDGWYRDRHPRPSPRQRNRNPDVGMHAPGAHAQDDYRGTSGAVATGLLRRWTSPGHT